MLCSPPVHHNNLSATLTLNCNLKYNQQLIGYPELGDYTAAEWLSIYSGWGEALQILVQLLDKLSPLWIMNELGFGTKGFGLHLMAVLLHSTKGMITTSCFAASALLLYILGWVHSCESCKLWVEELSFLNIVFKQKRKSSGFLLYFLHFG